MPSAAPLGERAEIVACASREPAPGALYTTLDRMEEKGLVTSRLGDPTPQRGGRAVPRAPINLSTTAQGVKTPGPRSEIWRKKPLPEAFAGSGRMSCGPRALI